MGSPLLHVGAAVQCMHGGSAMPVTPLPRVTLSGQPAVGLSSVYTVAGCPFPPPPAANGPCVTANWVLGAVRVTSMGVPLLLMSGSAVCVPTGTGLVVASAQTRVLGS